MKLNRWSLLILVALLPLAGGALADGLSVEMLRPAAGDLVAGELATRAPEPVAAASRDAVTFAWAVSPERPLAAPAAHRASSREYRVQVSADELRRGTPLYTLGAGAIVRLNALGDQGGTGLEASRIAVTSEAGQTFAAGEAVSTLVSDRELAAAGMPVAEGTVAFRLRPEVGAGALELRVDDAAAGRYLLHVFDAGSDLSLDLQATRSAYLAGDRLSAELSFARAGVAGETAEGWLVAPSGRTQAVEVTAAGGDRWRVSGDLPSAAVGALWELHVNAAGRVDGRKVVRSVRTAFGVGAATARFSGEVEGERAKSGALRLSLGVQAAVAGRYEVRGTLFGHRADGALVPFAAGHGAAWLEVGDGRVELFFDAPLVAGSGLEGPFEVRHLQLLDQGRLALLQEQARGLVLEP